MLPAYRRGAATALSNAKSFALITSAFAASGVLLGGVFRDPARRCRRRRRDEPDGVPAARRMRLDLAQRLPLSHMRGVEIAVAVLVAFGLKLVVEALQVLAWTPTRMRHDGTQSRASLTGSRVAVSPCPMRASKKESRHAPAEEDDDCRRADSRMAGAALAGSRSGTWVRP